MRDDLCYMIQRVVNSRRVKNFDASSAWVRMSTRVSVTEGLRFSPAWRVFVACFLAFFCFFFFTSDGPVSREAFFSPIPDTSFPRVHTGGAVELHLANGRTVFPGESTELREEALGVSMKRDSVNDRLVFRSDSVGVDTFETRYNRLEVPRGSEFTLELPDGSLVRVNSGSVFCFPVRFSPASRTVYLEGEAYFEVSRAGGSPFKVVTRDRSVTVLGTKFNVSSYREDRCWIATLVEGRVLVSDRGSSRELGPSEQYVVDKHLGTVNVHRVDVSIGTSWLLGQYRFKDCRLEDIIKRLERWYDFRTVYQDTVIKNLRFRGVIDKRRTLEKTLGLLEETGAISFEVRGDTVLPLRGSCRDAGLVFPVSFR